MQWSVSGNKDIGTIHNAFTTLQRSKALKGKKGMDKRLRKGERRIFLKNGEILRHS